MANADNLQTITSISSLPKHLVSEVLARVTSSSSTDLFRAKLCCKLFSKVSEEACIYQHVCLDKFEIVPWHKNHKVSMFLKKCRQARNPEALYQKGVVDYFRGKNLESGLECLEEAAKSGHDGAGYALGIIYLFGGEELKRKGMTMLSAMKKSSIQKRKVKDYRDNLRRILKMIWVNNSLVLSQRPICCAIQHNKKTGWLMDEIDEEESIYCACDVEIAPICDALPQFLV